MTPASTRPTWLSSRLPTSGGTTSSASPRASSRRLRPGRGGSARGSGGGAVLRPHSGGGGLGAGGGRGQVGGQPHPVLPGPRPRAQRAAQGVPQRERGGRGGGGGGPDQRAAQAEEDLDGDVRYPEHQETLPHLTQYLGGGFTSTEITIVKLYY